MLPKMKRDTTAPQYAVWPSEFPTNPLWKTKEFADYTTNRPTAATLRQKMSLVGHVRFVYTDSHGRTALVVLW